MLLYFSIAITSQSERFTIEFTNAQTNLCVVYLEDSFLGKIEQGEVFSTKLQGGVHHLSFVVFEPNGGYYTYLKDLNVKDSHHFLLLENDNGYIHLEKNPGITPFSLEAISHLPILTADNFNLIQLKLENSEFENSRFELIKREIVKSRITTSQLLQLMNFIQSSSMKSEIALLAQNHLIDSENLYLILNELDKNTVEKLTQAAEGLNHLL